MGILGWIILGLIAGAIAKAIMPGDDPGQGAMGIVITIVIGIVGAIIGGFVWNLITGADNAVEFSIGSLILAIIGSLILLAGYRMIAGRRSTA